MGWPQYVVLALIGLALVASISLNGKPRTGFHNGWASVALNGAYVWVLWMGGFFS